MDSFALLLGIGTGILSVLTFLGGAYAYIKSSATRKYAAEREIGHLKKSLEQLSSNVLFLDQDFDRRMDALDIKLIEIKDYLHRIDDSNKAHKNSVD